jgi:hypothetical protein
MGSDLTYAVVGGILETILDGYDARDAKKKAEAEAAAAKAEKEADNLFNNANNLVTHLSHKDNRGAAVSFIHGTAVPNSPAFNVYNSLDAYQQMQISTNAMGHLPDQLQEILTQAATNVEAARSLAQDQTILQMFSTSPMAMAQLSAYAAKPLSAQEQAIIDGAPKSADVPVQLAYYNSQKVIYPTGTPAGDYLDSVITNLGAIKPEREYTSVGTTVTAIENAINKEIENAKTQERTPSFEPILGQIRALKAQVAGFALDPDYAVDDDRLDDNFAAMYQFELFPNAVNDHIALDRLEKQIVSGAFGDTVEEIQGTDWAGTLDTYVKDLNDTPVGTGESGLKTKTGVAKDQIANLTKAGFKIEDFAGKTDDESLAIVSDYVVLKNMADLVNDVANNQMIFTSGTGNNERTFTFSMDERNPREALAEMNRIPNVGEFYKNLPDTGEGSKVEFLRRAEAMISLILTGTSGGEDNEAKEARPDLAIDEFAGYLFDEIPGFAQLVKDKGLPMAGDTTTGLVTTSFEQPADSNVFALNAQYSMTATDSVQQVAAAYGQTPQTMLLTNSVAYDLLRPGEQQPMRAFDAVNTLQKSGIFTMQPGVAMSNAQARNVVTTFIRHGQFDTGTQIDIMAAAIIDPKLPEGIAPAKYSTGFTLAELNSVIRTTLGHDVNFEDVSKAILNHTTFVTQAEEVEKLLMTAGISSQFTDDLSLSLLNVFGLKDSVIATIGDRIRDFAFKDNDALFSVDDMRVEPGGNAVAQRARIIEMSNEFVKQNFADNQAKLGAALVTLAYNYAKTMDPSGRISERDFQAALTAVQGDRKANVGARLALVRDILRKSRNELVYNEKVFKIKSTGTGNNTRYRLSKPHLQRMQALTHYRPLLRASRGIESIQRYKRLLNNVQGDVFLPNGIFNDVGLASEYSVSITAAEALLGMAVDASGQTYSIAEANNIGVLKLGPRPSQATDPLTDVPIYVDTRTGKIISNARIAQLTGRGI